MARKKKKSRGALPYIASIFLVIVLAAALFGYHYYQYIYGRNVHLTQDEVVLYIPTNTSYPQVKELLNQEGIIKNQESFDWVAQQKNYPNKIKPGRYLIQNKWSNNELVDYLRSGAQEPIQVKFNNISRLSQLAQIVSKQIEADSAQLMSAFLNEELLQSKGLNKQTVQAIFIPNTYEMYWNTSASQFVTRMKNEYDHFWNTENWQKPKN